jgi:putative ABC transport system permease protein
MKPSPPHSALKFLRWFCREDYIEELEGDLTEVFEKQYAQSHGKANWKFTWSVIRYFRPEFIKSFKRKQTLNHSAMFRHNLLLTYRTFKRYKMSFFINLVGLSTGLACALLIYLWVNDELHVDKFNAHDSQLYQVMENEHYAEAINTTPETDGILAEALAEEIPEIEYATTVTPVWWFEKFTLSVGDKNVKATGRYAGKDYFNIFSFHLLRGDESQVLADKNSIVISEALALRLFNTTDNIIGKAIEFQQERQFLISGVFEGTPANSTDQFDFVLSFDVFQEKNPQFADWGHSGTATYVMLKEGTNPDQFNHKIADFLKRKTGVYENTTLFARPFSDSYLYGKYENGVEAGGRVEYVRLFSIIAIFILLIACINFMNLSTAKATRRLKEVGIKKAIGAGRKALVFQYLGESVLMALVSLTTSILLILLFLPQFNAITGKHLTLSFDINLIFSVLGLTFFTGILAGSYPALYLSGFNPVSILKGSTGLGRFKTSVGEVWVRKGLVVFQFTLSVILIVAVLVVYKQIEFIQTKNIGYDKDNLIIFDMEGKVKENPETFLSAIKNVPGIVNASSTNSRLIGSYGATTGVQWEGKNPDDIISFEIIEVNYDLIETLDMEISAGRSFSRDFGADVSKLIINEAARDVMRFQDAAGRTINLWGNDVQILGVAKNFHIASFHEAVKPMLIRLMPEYTDYIMAKIEAGRERETLAQLQAFYQEYNPGFVLDYKFLDAQYQALYEAENRVATLSRYFAGLAILISCLGLFGLVSFTAERRLKEIGIRKILGATNFGIVRLLSADFTRMVLIAIVVALPISYFIAKNWLEGFAYRIDLEWWFFVGAGLLALLIAWFTVVLQTIKAARVNPTKCLKDE